MRKIFFGINSAQTFRLWLKSVHSLFALILDFTITLSIFTRFCYFLQHIKDICKHFIATSLHFEKNTKMKRKNRKEIFQLWHFNVLWVKMYISWIPNLRWIQIYNLFSEHWYGFWENGPLLDVTEDIYVSWPCQDYANIRGITK